MARRRPARRRSGQAGPAAAQRQRAGADRRAAALGQALRRAQGHHRAAVGGARRAPARRRALRGGGRRGADGAVVRRPDQRPLAADDDPPRRARRPAGARSGRARQRGLERLARRPRRDGHRRRRLDRRRAVPPDRALPPGAARAVRPVRSTRSTRSSRRCRTSFPQLPLATLVGDVKHAVAGRAGARARAAERHLPCRGVQARAADGGDQRLAGGAQQCLRHVGAGARRGRGQGREVRAGLDRQGGQSDQRDGRVEAPRRDRLPEPAERRARSSSSCASATCSAARAA